MDPKDLAREFGLYRHVSAQEEGTRRFDDMPFLFERNRKLAIEPKSRLIKTDTDTSYMEIYISRIDAKSLSRLRY